MMKKRKNNICDTVTILSQRKRDQKKTKEQRE